MDPNVRYEKLSAYASRHDIKYRAAWNRYKKGTIDGVIKEDGHILVPIPTKVTTNRTHINCVIYARVSSSQNKNNLHSQAERLTSYSIAKGYTICSVVKETASGLNDTRPKLHKMFADPTWDVLVVEHKDRLTRFGYAYLELLAQEQHRRIEVVNQTTDDNDADILEDLVSIITSFMARIYGRRRSQRKTEKIVKELLDKGDDS